MTTRLCTVWFCHDDHYARGYCASHYQNWRRYGSPVSPKNRDMIDALRFVGVCPFCGEKDDGHKHQIDTPSKQKE